MPLDDWKKGLRPASFRGVTFMVPGHGNQFGLRGVTHEYPLKDKPFREELGRRAEGFQIEAIIGGPDYMAARDSLKAACLKGGPGKLVHPYLGSLTVKFLEGSLTESTEMGGLATFSLSFVESGEEVYPTQAIDAQAAVTDSASTVQAKAAEVFTEDYSVRGPGFLAEAVIRDIKAAVTMARRIVRSVVGPAADEVFTALDQAVTLTTAAVSQASTVVTKVTAVVSAVASVKSPGDALAAFRALEELTQFGAVMASGHPASSLAEPLSAIPFTTATRAVQAANRGLLQTLTRVTATAEAAAAALGLEPASYQQAAELRDGLDALLRTEILSAGDAGHDDLYRALTSLQAEVIPALTEQAVNLPKLRTFTVPPGGRDILVIASTLYGSPDRAEEILARNGLQGQGLIRGGTELEVLGV